MKTLLLLFLLFSNDCSLVSPVTTTVYICASSSAKRYHLNKNCKGLSSCQHRVIKLTLDQAKKKGRTLCGWEK